MDGSVEDAGFVRKRVAKACDACKARKVRCDGKTPCTYCSRRRLSSSCHYGASIRRRRQQGQDAHSPLTPSAVRPHSALSSHSLSREGSSSGRAAHSHSHSNLSTPHASRGRTPHQSRRQSTSSPAALEHEHDETEVPREARLICDEQGKLTFIGDCAPLSFFQTVRQLVTARVDRNAFAPQTSRYTVLENVHPGSLLSSAPGLSANPPSVVPGCVPAAVTEYLATTTVLVDLFEDSPGLSGRISRWAHHRLFGADEAQSAVYYLVLAIGCLKTDATASQQFFEHAKSQAFGPLIGDLCVATVQAYTLITLYMLMTGQINGAFLFFGIAVRAAYSIGLHRTEVNARFGQEIHRQRDRMWKSLKVIDLFLSTSMGRPPATSDVDCSVPFEAVDEHEQPDVDVQNASVQIFGIMEVIVVEIYQRRKISSQLTEGISRRLREWSLRWMPLLKDAVAGTPSADTARQVNGSCQVLASYYYAVMLVSRPFLMYELHRRLSPDRFSASEDKEDGRPVRTRLADACIDAASLMVDPIIRLTNAGVMQGRFPLIVSWLFASSLVLGVGLLGGFGRALEKHTRMAISALENFARGDAHAVQYSLIAKSLLSTALDFLEKREAQERVQRTESSSQLFGLIPSDPPTKPNDASLSPTSPSSQPVGAINRYGVDGPVSEAVGIRPMFSEAGGGGRLPFSDPLSQTPDFFGDLFDLENGQDFGALNLFPLLDGGGHIDLAHHF